VIRRHADAFRRYEPFVLPGRVLDWGCRQGVDSSLLREAFGDDIEIHGCDMLDEPYRVFAAHSGLVFARLEHPSALPYAGDSFDTVIGSGVLEHVDRPAESLLEVHRVLRPGGHLVITFLPNLYSLTELARTALRQPHHARRYTARRIDRELRGSGFEPLYTGYHQVLPTLSGPASGAVGGVVSLRRPIERLYDANRWLEQRRPFNRVAANLLVIARRV